MVSAMIVRLLRLLSVLLVAAGILLPKVSAAAVSMGLLDLRYVVICSGDGMRVIALDGSGTPVEEVRSDPCAFLHALDHVPALPLPGMVWRLSGTVSTTLGPLTLRAGTPFFNPLPRGPPLS
ncbi:hypothetical protein CG51_10150 [Haematobacter missouriensis]|uniref:DUF2946 domain-containing protein n=2 Tax=Haematobacter missouriensis TaxID=366616 RepID=A0A212AW43_9RHOB|nr:hypothetical protein CG51_10150 [Haematobacter missouriensis]OWJ77689.1 hypothetical protein CDV53_05205 [Haematobacter missouriensis]OWJ85690.1 hypothetical protein CDV52_04915 [Haematobacter missouriensis]